MMRISSGLALKTPMKRPPMVMEILQGGSVQEEERHVWKAVLEHPL